MTEQISHVISADDHRMDLRSDKKQGILLSESYLSSAPTMNTVPNVNHPMAIHANAGEVFREDAMANSSSPKTGMMPILSEAMKEIIAQPGDSPQICVQPSVLDQLPQQQELQSQFNSYVTVAVDSNEKVAENDQIGQPEQTQQIQGVTENENQNNCSYQQVDLPANLPAVSLPECVIADGVECGPHQYDDSSVTSSAMEATSPKQRGTRSFSRSRSRPSPIRGISIETPMINGYQKPRINIVQQILEAFKATSKTEMHPSDVYEAVQTMFPYYRQLEKKKKKSWMSSIRHALVSSRFKGRRVHDGTQKSTMRRGSLWSLNENFTSEGSGSKRRYRTRGSARRKQKLAGRTRPDFSEMENFTTMTQRLPSMQMYQTPAAQMTHMQSTFAPGQMVYPNYPMMGYMPPQPQPVYQHPVPGQPWLPMQQPQQQAQPQTDNNQGPPCSKQIQTPQQMPAGNTGQMNVMSQQGPQMQIPGQQMQAPGSQMPTQGNMQDLRSIVYQNMNMTTNNSNSQGLPTSRANEATMNAKDSVETSVPPSSGIPEAPNQQSMAQAPCSNPPQRPMYQQGMVYGGSMGQQVPAPTSMNWSYAQPPAQYYQPAPQQNYNMGMNPANGIPPEGLKPIYPGMSLPTQQMQSSGGGTSGLQKISPAPFNSGGAFQQGVPQQVMSSHRQYISPFEHGGGISNATGIKNEMSMQ